MPSPPASHLPYYKGSNDSDDNAKPKQSHFSKHRHAHFFSRRKLVALFTAACFISFAAGAYLSALSLRSPPRTVTVFRCGRAVDTLRTFAAARARSESENGETTVSVLPEDRPKVLALVGVHTSFGSADRRAALRSTWFLQDPNSLINFEQTSGLAFRFVIGRTNDPKKMSALQKEVDIYHDFMFIDVKEEDLKLPLKALSFFKSAFSLFNAEFYVKITDNIYLRPDRLATLLAKERAHRRTYIGCMKKGPVITDPKNKWYESLGDVMGHEYFMHAYGTIYALSSEIVEALAVARDDSLRMFNHEDVTIGAWMLALNVNHEENKAMCDTTCTPTSIAVWDVQKCSGLCNPVSRLKELHNSTMCTKSPTIPPEEDE